MKAWQAPPRSRSWQAAAEAAVILFIVDAKSGPEVLDYEILKGLRKLSKPMVPGHLTRPTAAKTPKMPSMTSPTSASPMSCQSAAAHQRGVPELLDLILEILPERAEPEAAEDDGIMRRPSSAGQERFREIDLGKPLAG